MHKDYEILQASMEKHLKFNKEEFATFSRSFQRHHIPKKKFILNAGEVCKFEAFVVKGCFRVFYLDEKGAENILYFAVENWWVTDIASFTNQIPTEFYIEALEDSTILSISYEEKQRLFVTLPMVEKLFRVMTQKAFAALQKRLLSSLNSHADQRYLDFKEKYPTLVNKLTQQHIASYIGITHEFLSKIKRKLLFKDKQ